MLCLKRRRLLCLHHPRPRLSHSASSNNPTSDLSRLLQGPIPRAHLLQVHARVFLLHAHQNDLIATRLIGRYPSNSALKVFNHLRNPNIFPFNAIIRVLAEEGFSSNAFVMYKQLKFRQISPNDLTFSFLFKACSRGAIGGDTVKLVHSDVFKYGFICDPLICNGLLMVYAKAVKDLSSARKLFDEMPDRNLVSCWTSLISGYAKIGLAGDALELFVIMLKENLCPESDTMVSVLSACSSLTAHQVEKWVNSLTQLVKSAAWSDLACDFVNTALVYLYGKYGDVENSRNSFDEISDDGKKTVLCWNSIVGAYVQNGCALEALDVFKSMMEDYNCRPNHVTMVNVLSACAEVGDLDLGSWVHEYLRSGGQKGVLSSNVNLATALIDMYSKCGDLDGARGVFEQMSMKDVVSFNAMIIGLAVNGKGDEALRLYSKMQELSLHPDSGTLLGVLCACSHSGLLDKGREIFEGMLRSNSVIPKLEHYACYVDILARSGLIDEALGVVASMPFEPNNFVWGALLAGCVLHNRLELVQALSTDLVKVDPMNSAGYIMLSNSFASDCQWRRVMKTRGVMREKGVAKQPGCSWIKIGGIVHEFVAGSASCCEFESVHQVLESLLKEMRLVGS
ncbi:hypothetical protein SASPL_115384 [Salvia splendens]|uniref:Uncharacterized protein n=1 Tax=Salvia splendens TaxID=180675 RepID=A0A8X9A230_SALSN|nr:pentatricopeptide repeat-containing protein At3g12770-like [Salvia splendens]KAG6424961.1 hypothetical protein SASPL_115384 [Salvia splendens]